MAGLVPRLVDSPLPPTIALPLTPALTARARNVARAFARAAAAGMRAWGNNLIWLAALICGCTAVPACARPTSASAPVQAATAPRETAPVTIGRADFRRSPDERWTQVALPDTWTLRDLPGTGGGEYRMVLTLAEAPREPWALELDRVSPARQVYVNGELVDAYPPGGRMVPLPALVELPLHLLHAGDNELHLVLQYRHRGGLSRVRAGPIDSLERSHERLLWWEKQLPQQLNLVACVLAMLMLAVAWRQPREKAIGLFGALGLISGIRNYVTLDDMLSWPGDWMERFAFTAMIWMAMLFLAYAHRMRFQRALPHGRLFWALLGSVPAIVACLPAAWLPPVRLLAYAVLAVVNLRSVQNVAMSARLVRDAPHRALCAFLLVIFLAALHDFAYQIVGWLPITQSLALSHVLPLALCCYSGLLLVRLFDAMAEVDRLNRTLEARVARRTRDLEAANAAKTHFITSASHDLRQPLVSIGLLLGLLRQELSRAVPNAAVHGLLERLARAVSAMEELLKRLLDFSRLEGAGNAPASLRPVHMQEILDAVLAHEASHAEAKGLRLRVRATSLTVRSDPVMLEQILRNLVSNAIRYTERGGVLVGVRARKSSGQAQLCVWDSGRGIAPADQEIVFEPFVQLNNPGRVTTEGLGLGLAIARRAAVQLGHDLALVSQPGRGSCFRLTLPLADGTANLPGPSQARSPAPDSSVLRGRAVWLIEDNDAVRDALALQLVQWGARLESFSRAADFRQRLLCAQDWPDLVISDARLPDGDGLELIRSIQADAPVPVAGLLVTGNTAPAQLATQASSGIAVLHKPFGSEALLEAISHELRTCA
ncbi:ATP-binding protein [Cupriavidus sp. 30B13]|uniref:ATP-binding response regulator n=1 Tax=Cupriavidus sp. 30B13 TaxID=3384241 RepID=UPI003B90C68B